jgi:hypothetical protein
VLRLTHWVPAVWTLQDLHLAVVEEADREAVEDLLELFEFKHQFAVFEERYSAILVYFILVRVFTGRADLHQYPNDIVHCEGFSFLYLLSVFHEGPIAALVGDAFLAAKREGAIVGVVADADSE